MRLEELEARALLSAGGSAGWVAEPNLRLVPDGVNGAAPYSPYQVRHAYGFDRLSLTGAGQTIAIVDAYDHPNVLSDLMHFDRAFGLPDPVFTKATPQGQPSVDNGWAGEIALDVEWAHAIAYRANILLVEAKSAGDDDLLAAVDYARNYPGVVAVSMSWGGPEFANEASFDSHFTTPAGHAGVTFIAASGDHGGGSGPEWPSVSPNVLAVGGTALSLNSQNNYGGETTWASGGGGYGRYEREPAYQTAAQSSGVRTAPDVAYDASPATGFYVYVSLPQGGQTGWFSYGGTSAGAPQWAALVALADQGRAGVGKGALAGTPALTYGLPVADFHDVTAGSNGFSAHGGYDLATGRGSPVADRLIADLVRATGVTVTASASIGSVGGSAAARANEPAVEFRTTEWDAGADRNPISRANGREGVDAVFAALPELAPPENGVLRNGTPSRLASDAIRGPRRGDKFWDLIDVARDRQII